MFLVVNSGHAQWQNPYVGSEFCVKGHTISKRTILQLNLQCMTHLTTLVSRKELCRGNTYNVLATADTKQRLFPNARLMHADGEGGDNRSMYSSSSVIHMCSTCKAMCAECAGNSTTCFSTLQATQLQHRNTSGKLLQNVHTRVS